MMNTRVQPPEFMQEDHPASPGMKFSIRSILDGKLLAANLIIKQLPFLVFLVFWGIVYIGNRYHAENIARQTESLSLKVKDLRAEALMTSRELMQKTREQEILRMLRERGMDLYEPVRPPVRIKR